MVNDVVSDSLKYFRTSQAAHNPHLPFCAKCRNGDPLDDHLQKVGSTAWRVIYPLPSPRCNQLIRGQLTCATIKVLVRLYQDSIA